MPIQKHTITGERDKIPFCYPAENSQITLPGATNFSARPPLAYAFNLKKNASKNIPLLFPFLSLTVTTADVQDSAKQYSLSPNGKCGSL
jgi:hypothetical protein